MLPRPGDRVRSSWGASRTTLISASRRLASRPVRLVTHTVAVRTLRLGSARGTVCLIGVYRRRNAAYVRKLVDAACSAGWSSAWWALDEVASELAEHTVGAGVGEKFPLLNEIIRRVQNRDGWIVVADDDFVFVRGGLVRLVKLCERAGFALAQPAHTAASAHSHEITLSRALSIARATTFVEIGPLFVVAPWCRERIVPFPGARGMGWGLELDWRRLLDHGCLLGVVDAVNVVHLGQVGQSYDVASLERGVRRELMAAGVSAWRDLQQTSAVWRPWQRRPPWTTRTLARSAST